MNAETMVSTRSAGSDDGLRARLVGHRGLLTSSTRFGRRSGNLLLLLLLIPVGYLVLTPLIRLQQLALEDDARGVQDGARRPQPREGPADDARPGAGLARHRPRPRHRPGVVQLAPAAAVAMDGGVADPADRHARRRVRHRLGVPALAPGRLHQRRPAPPPVVERPQRRPHRHLHADVDRDPHRVRPDVVHLRVHARRHAPAQLRAHRGRLRQRRHVTAGVLHGRRPAAPSRRSCTGARSPCCSASASSRPRCCSGSRTTCAC